MGIVNQTLMRASRACDYIYNTVRFRTLNQPEGINRTQDIEDYNSLLESFGVIRNEFHNHFKIKIPTSSLEITEYVEGIALQSQFGFCDDVVALAFQYL